MSRPDFDYLAELLGHDRWATDHLLTVCECVSEGDLDREFDIGLRTIRRTFDHYVRATNFWNVQMEGEPVPALPDPVSIADLQTFHHAIHDRFAQRAAELTVEARLGETFIDIHGTPHQFGTTIVHMTQHNHVHRSEILHMLHRLGVENLTEGDIMDWEERRAAS